MSILPSATSASRRLFVTPRSKSLIEAGLISPLIITRDIGRYLAVPSDVERQVAKWNRNIPWITPYYAMKSNSSPWLVAMLTTLGVRLDVASPAEDRMANMYTRRITPTRAWYGDAYHPSKIYTNPYTSRTDIDVLRQSTPKVVDSVGEIMHMHANGCNPPLLLRIKVPDGQADTRFSDKFGVDPADAGTVITCGHQLGFTFVGTSFHIGSGGTYDRSSAYKAAVKIAIKVMAALPKATIIDIGGGCLHTTDLRATFEWTRDLPYNVYAEPGRFFSAPSHALVVEVTGVNGNSVYMDNGVYHELNAVKRDHWTWPTTPHKMEGDTVCDDFKSRRFTVWGPTCDSSDMVSPSYSDGANTGGIVLPEDVRRGDRFVLDCMGAYTCAGAVDFNGIKSASSR